MFPFVEFQTQQLEGRNIELANCDLLMVEPELTQCKSQNQIAKRLNAIKSPFICREFGSR